MSKEYKRLIVNRAPVLYNNSYKDLADAIFRKAVEDWYHMIDDEFFYPANNHIQKCEVNYIQDIREKSRNEIRRYMRSSLAQMTNKYVDVILHKMEEDYVRDTKGVYKRIKNIWEEPDRIGCIGRYFED